MASDEQVDGRESANEPEPTRPDVGVAFSPRGIIGGFVLLAALLLLLRRRRRTDQPTDD
jgi:MYXO-CTERM domain-containing protein